MTESRNDPFLQFYSIIVSLMILLLSIADLTTQSSNNYYDQHDAMEDSFPETFFSNDDSIVSPAVPLTDDTRFSAAEPSWEMKLNNAGAEKHNIAPRVLDPKSKRNCGLPSITARGLIGTTMKRSEFAVTRAELDEKLMKDEENRKKREIKRSQVVPENYWACETKYDWIDMGTDHYPRYVRTARCESRRCANGIFHCNPRTYKTKILKRISPSDSPVCEEADDSLPTTLRVDWRLITVTITHCCDCSALASGQVA